MYEMTSYGRGHVLEWRVVFDDPGPCPICGETVTPAKGKRWFYWKCEKCWHWRRAQPGEIVEVGESTGVQEAQGSGEKVPGVKDRP